MGKEQENPIKVYARVRPLTRREIERNDDVVLKTYEDVKKIKIFDRKHLYESTYIFDRVFSAADTNDTVFTFTTKHYITKLLNGTNCSLIAYGQTGSGKTHTLMADGGVTDYTISDLFYLIGQDRFHRYKITCSFVQIYLEKVFDILGSNSKRELPVREHPYKGIHVQGLSEHEVSDATGVYDLFNKGKDELMKAETEMEHFSSRSHSIFQISIEKSRDAETLNILREEGDEEVTTSQLPRAIPQGLDILDKETTVAGKVAICDLAGSERFGRTLVERTNQNEAKYINSSLLQLGNVIYALSDRRQRRHVPFRNSTLTRLLQECLGSKCITAFIICVAPSCKDIHETVCSLNFGTRARTITNKVRIFSGKAKRDFLNKRLSSKIFLLENKLRKSLCPQTMFADCCTQTESCATYYIDSYIDMTKRSLELSELLDLFVESKRDNVELSNKDNVDLINKYGRIKDRRQRIADDDHHHPVSEDDHDSFVAEDDHEQNIVIDDDQDHLAIKDDRNFVVGVDDPDHHVSDDDHGHHVNEDGHDHHDIKDEHDHHFKRNDHVQPVGENASDTSYDHDSSIDYNDNFERIVSESSDYEDYDVNSNCIHDNQVEIYCKKDHDSKHDNNKEHNLDKNKKIISVFVVATKHISRILIELQSQLAKVNSRQSTEIIKTLDRCKRRLESFEDKITRTNLDDIGYEFFEDTNISISEVCCDIKYNIKSILKRMDNVLHVVQSMENTSTAHAWFTNLNNLLNTLDNNEQCFLKGSNVCYIYYLVYLLQLLQIIRLSLVYSSKTLKTQQEVFPSKPLICSTSLEDTTVSSTTSADPMERFDRIPRINPPKNNRGLKPKGKRSSSDFTEEKSRIVKKSNYVCKLYRQPAIKIKHNHLSSTFSNASSMFNTTYTIMSGRHQGDSRTERNKADSRHSLKHDSIERFCYEKKRKSMENRVKRSRSFGVDREYIPPHSRQLFNMYEEIQKKYEEAVEENNLLWSSMKILEDEDAVNIERRKLEEQIRMYYVESKRKEEELLLIKGECLRYKKILEHAEEVLRQSTRDALRLEKLLEEKNNTMATLEAAKHKMNNQKEEHIEQNKKMEEIREGIILFQQIFESCISLSEDLLCLSDNIEKTSIQHGTKSFESVMDLEGQVYRLMESNVRYENILDDIRHKVKYAVGNVETIHLKSGQSQTDTSRARKASKEPDNPKADTTKLTEMILSCDDEMIQTILLDDLRNSTDKYFAILKDMKASVLIKELLREKIKLDGTINEMKNKLKEQDTNLAQNKRKIELFVKELGKLDQQLNGGVAQPQYCYDFSMLKMGSRYATFPRAHEHIEIVHVPGLCFDKFTLYLHYYTNGLPPPRPKPVHFQPPEGVQMILVEELDELKSEIDFYKRKCKEIETQYSKLSTCLEQDLSSTNKSLMCKIEYLKHLNSIIEKENRNIKSRNMEQKNQVKILKDENCKIQDQVEVCRCQSMQIQAKTEIERLQLEKKLSKYKEKLSYLENYIDVMISKRETNKRHVKDFDDSGLTHEDSDNYADFIS